MGEPPDFAAEAQGLLAYFIRLADEQPHRPEWREGADAASAWIEALATGHSASAERVASLIEASTYDGSGWAELRLRFSDWRATASR